MLFKNSDKLYSMHLVMFIYTFIEIKSTNVRTWVYFLKMTFNTFMGLKRGNASLVWMPGYNIHRGNLRYCL